MHPKWRRLKLKYCLWSWVSQCSIKHVLTTDSLTQTPAATLKSSPTRCVSDSFGRKAAKNRKRWQLVLSGPKQPVNYKLTNRSLDDKKIVNQTAWRFRKLLEFKRETSRCKRRELCKLLQNKIIASSPKRKVRDLKYCFKSNQVCLIC